MAIRDIYTTRSPLGEELASRPRSRVIQLVDPESQQNPFEPVDVDLGSDAPRPEMEGGVLRIEHSDGSATIDFSPLSSGESSDSKDFYGNLADKIELGELSTIASQLLEGIEYDLQSRKEEMDTRARGIKLLGLKIEEPRTDVGTSSAPLEGMSTVRHPLLLEAVVRAQATLRGELLPTAGPVKIRNDATMAPAMPPGTMPPGVQAQGPAIAQTDELATALEKDFNHYLTSVAREYVPDTDRMLFRVPLFGDGYKKVYHCPLRNRPVSESVDAEDLIVSNSTIALADCGRITQRIKMRPSVMRRMQIIGAYRDCDLGQPVINSPDPVEEKKNEIKGQKPPQRPADADYELYEVYCELDLPQYAPKQFKDKGLPLPYRVTLEQHSRQVLEVVRNWKEDDELCLARQVFVQYPYIRGLGFYGLGLIHMLGNTTMALTAMWREMLDAGMFSNFPGFLYAKLLGRQNSNQMRVAPGSGLGVELSGLDDIRKAIMPVPYKDISPGFSAYAQHVEELGQRLGGAAQIQIGEGKQDAPVGTTLALIEQATKLEDAVHKRLHAAQAEEFALLKELFREDPEAFWRHNKRPAMQWKKDQFIAALNNYDLVPVADPNNPTSLHRIAKAVVIKTLQGASPGLYNPVAVDTRIMRIIGIDAEGLFNPTPAAPPPDPRFEAIKQKAAAQERLAQIQQFQAMIKAATEHDRLAANAQDQASRERIEGIKLQLAQMQQENEQIIHAHSAAADQAQQLAEHRLEVISRAQEMHQSAQEHAMDMEKSRQERADAAQQHALDLQHGEQLHQQKMRHTDALNAAQLEAKRAQARATQRSS